MLRHNWRNYLYIFIPQPFKGIDFLTYQSFYLGKKDNRGQSCWDVMRWTRIRVLKYVSGFGEVLTLLQWWAVLSCRRVVAYEEKPRVSVVNLEIELWWCKVCSKLSIMVSLCSGACCILVHKCLRRRFLFICVGYCWQEPDGLIGYGSGRCLDLFLPFLRKPAVSHPSLLEHLSLFSPKSLGPESWHLTVCVYVRASIFDSHSLVVVVLGGSSWSPHIWSAGPRQKHA